MALQTLLAIIAAVENDVANAKPWLRHRRARRLLVNRNAHMATGMDYDMAHHVARGHVDHRPLYA